MLMVTAMSIHTLGEVVVEVFLLELSHWKEVGLYRLVQLAMQTRAGNLEATLHIISGAACLLHCKLNLFHF